MKKSDWGIEIIKTNNGFLIKDNSGEVTVIEENSDNNSKAAEELLWSVIEFFNLRGSRYEKNRVLVTIEVGDKYQAEKGEKIKREYYYKLVKTSKSK